MYLCSHCCKSRRDLLSISHLWWSLLWVNPGCVQPNMRLTRMADLFLCRLGRNAFNPQIQRVRFLCQRMVRISGKLDVGVYGFVRILSPD